MLFDPRGVGRDKGPDPPARTAQRRAYDDGAARSDLHGERAAL